MSKIAVLRHFKSIPRHLLIGTALTASLYAQEPSAGNRPVGNDAVSAAAIAGSKQDPAAFKRGIEAYAQYCSGCHGAAGRGGAGAPDLMRSLLVLDDEQGNMIAPVLREGRPDKGMPKLNLTEPQIASIVAWLHVRTYSAGHRVTYTFGNVVTGDAKQGQAYFQSKCGSCHSTTGDLAGIGAKYDSMSLQSRWIQPRGGARRGPASPKMSAAMMPTAKVTLASGQVATGTLDRIDDFTVSLYDSSGQFQSFSREVAGTRVEVTDPMQAHTDLLRVYTDADIHNVTAYLVSVK